MKAKILSLLVLTALSGNTLAATPPDTLVVVQSWMISLALIRLKVMSYPVFRPSQVFISGWCKPIVIIRQK